MADFQNRWSIVNLQAAVDSFSNVATTKITTKHNIITLSYSLVQINYHFIIIKAKRV